MNASFVSGNHTVAGIYNYVVRAGPLQHLTHHTCISPCQLLKTHNLHMKSVVHVHLCQCAYKCFDQFATSNAKHCKRQNIHQHAILCIHLWFELTIVPGSLIWQKGRCKQVITEQDTSLATAGLPLWCLLTTTAAAMIMAISATVPACTRLRLEWCRGQNMSTIC